MAQILRHLPAVLALTAPSPHSYARLVPHRWSAAAAVLGEQNREATLRICPVVPLGGMTAAGQLHLEFRAADRTLTDADVAPVRERIVAALREHVGGELRG